MVKTFKNLILQGQLTDDLETLFVTAGTQVLSSFRGKYMYRKLPLHKIDFMENLEDFVLKIGNWSYLMSA